MSDMCVGCNSISLVLDKVSGEIICVSCGMVKFSRILNDEAEWRVFEGDNRTSSIDPCRVSGEVDSMLSGGGITTEISNNSQLSDIQSRVNSECGDQRIISLFNQAQSLCSKLSLPDSCYQRCRSLIHKNLSDLDSSVGTSIRSSSSKSAFVSSIVYQCSQFESTPRSLVEVAARGECNSKRKICSFNYKLSSNSTQVPRCDKSSLIIRYATSLAFPPRSIQLAANLASSLEASTRTTAVILSCLSSILEHARLSHARNLNEFVNIKDFLPPKPVTVEMISTVTYFSTKIIKKHYLDTMMLLVQYLPLSFIDLIKNSSPSVDFSLLRLVEDDISIIGNGVVVNNK